MPTTPETVDAIVSIMADVEALAEQVKTKLDQLPDLLHVINQNGDAGVLITKAYSQRAKAIGQSLKAEAWNFHSDMTEAAKARGIDVPGIEGSGGR